MSSLLHPPHPPPVRRPLVAFAALFTALSGTGYAALMITGANVANGSLTGVDIENKSLGGKEMKADTLRGSQIKESSLGTVPSATHAATADSAANATNATKAADADTLDGIDSAGLMTVKPRVFETNYDTNDNFGDNATLGTLANLEGGQYLVTAKLMYDNDGVFEQETCTLHVPARRHHHVPGRRGRDRDDHPAGGRLRRIDVGRQRQLHGGPQRRHDRPAEHHRRPAWTDPRAGDRPPRDPNPPRRSTSGPEASQRYGAGSTRSTTSSSATTCSPTCSAAASARSTVPPGKQHLSPAPAQLWQLPLSRHRNAS